MRSGSAPIARRSLAAGALSPLPCGSIRAHGWLGRQLRLAARGLTGRLGEIWEDVGPTSGWLGGGGESWERGPYYVRGLVSLAHALGDADLAAKARPWIDWTLASQSADGFFGPRGNADWWARMPMLEALRIHGDATRDPRVSGFLSRYHRHQLAALPSRPLADWARPRGADNVEAALWLFARTQEPFLLELADLLHEQTSDWLGELAGDGPPSEAFEFAHGVNRAMGFRAAATRFWRTGDRSALDALRRGWRRTMEHHGQVHGLYSCDEFLHGRGATQGTELCAIVEQLSSFHLAQHLSGELWIADAIERIALNALPATIAPDHRSHQYFQQANQIACTPGAHGFGIHHETDLLFGPATGYGCCAASFHVAWPELVHHLWYATAQGGIAALQLAPSEVRTTIAATPVRVRQETDYPFGDTVRFVVEADRPVRFPLALRIPGWATRARLALEDGGAPVGYERDLGRLIDAPRSGDVTFRSAMQPDLPEAPPAGALVEVERTWRSGDALTLELPMEVRLSRWERGSVALERGPLVYALAVAEEWRRVGGREPFCDYELHPRSPWAYALCVREQTLASDVRVIERPLAPQPWARSGASTWLEAPGLPVTSWGVANDSAAPVPEAPVAGSGAPEPLIFLPYGCARLRVATLPIAG